MQKLQPNTSDLVFFKALISTERWRHFFHQQTVNHIFVGNMLRVKKSGWWLWLRSNANYFGHSCWRHPRPTLGCLQETPTPLVFCVQAVKHYELVKSRHGLYGKGGKEIRHVFNANLLKLPHHSQDLLIVEPHWKAAPQCCNAQRSILRPRTQKLQCCNLPFY